MRVDQPTIQVLTPHMTVFVGEVDAMLHDAVYEYMDAGLLRAEGFIERLLPDEVSCKEGGTDCSPTISAG
jgi:hypothetical protein